MADIRSEILSKYDIDIAQDNIFKLYKLESPDLSEQELETKIEDARKRWEISVNGANEKTASRDRLRLAKADLYESILRDKKLRKALYNFYHKQAGGTAAGANGAAEFARDFFKLVSTTKKIKKADVDFFFHYFPHERKNKKAILEMLSREFKISGLGKTDVYADRAEQIPVAKQKSDGSPLVVNLFQEETVLKIGRIMEKYTAARQSSELCGQYPKLTEGLYAFLEIAEVKTASDFIDLMSNKRKEVYAVRQEKGTEYVLLLDLFNILEEMGQYRDVADNIAEFKLLLKYPELTPYMYAFVEMKPATVKGVLGLAGSDGDYLFQNEADFILNFYLLVYDNFGISNNGIGALIRKAQKKAKPNKARDIIEAKLGRNGKKKETSGGVRIIYWLVYWPIYVVYFVLVAVKAILGKLHMLKIPAFIFLFCLFNWLLPRLFDTENMLILGKLFTPTEWVLSVEDFLGASSDSWFGMILLSLAAVVWLAAIYVLPAFFGARIFADFADDFNKRFDWVGYERTFQNLFRGLKHKTQNQFLTQKKTFIRNKIPAIIMNLICLGILLLILGWILLKLI